MGRYALQHSHRYFSASHHEHLRVRHELLLAEHGAVLSDVAVAEFSRQLDKHHCCCNGPRVNKHRDAAMASEPNNARVRCLLGVCQFHTAAYPSEWREALATLLSAEKLFAEEAKRPAQPLEPRWGRSSCLTFIGRTYESLGETAKAEEFFCKALPEHPADVLAKDGLTRISKIDGGRK